MFDAKAGSSFDPEVGPGLVSKVVPVFGPKVGPGLVPKVYTVLAQKWIHVWYQKWFKFWSKTVCTFGAGIGSILGAKYDTGLV